MSVLVLLAAGGCRGDRRRALRDLHSKEPRQRADAVLTLASIDGPKALDRIGPLVKDPSAGVRLAVVRAVSRIKDRRAVTLLLMALRDKDPQVRLAAVIGLGKSADPRARDQLVHMLDDRDPVIRRASRAALTRMGLDRAAQVAALARVQLESLLSAAQSARPGVRVQAAERLGRCGLPGAEDALERLLADRNGQVADEALVALARLGSARALGLVRRTLAHGGFEAWDRFMAALAGIEPAQWAVLADILDADKVAVLAPSLQRACRKGKHCPVGCKVLCRWIGSKDWTVARAAYSSASDQSCGCVEGALEGLSDREKQIFLSLSVGQSLSSKTWKGLLAQYRTRLPHPGMGPFLERAPAMVQDAVRQAALAAAKAYVEDSVSWLSEEQWRKLESDPGATALGRPPAKPQDKRAKKLARLLSRYRPRSWRGVELLPTVVSVGTAMRAVDLLGWLPRAEADLVRFASSGPSALRRAALSALAHRTRKVDDELVAVIRSALAGDAKLRAAAATALRCAKLKAVVMLSQILWKDPSDQVRAAAAESLGAIDAPQARKALRNALRHRVEPAVIAALVHARDGEAAPILLSKLKANPSDPRLSTMLVDALGMLGSSQTPGLVDALADRLGHPEPAVRAAAAEALGRIGDAKVAGLLRVCSEDFSLRVRRACRKAVALIRAKR